MKYKILLFGLVAAIFTGCSSVYRASQTPDDVYYSPAREGTKRAVAREDRYEEYVSSQDDRYLRMKVRDRERWSMIDDYSYWNDSRYVPYYNYNYLRNSMYSPYAWNNWYSPYGSFSPYGLSMNMGYYNWMNGSYLYPNYMYGGIGYSPYTNVYINKYPTRVSPNVNRTNLNAYRNRQYNNRNYEYYNNGRSGYGNTSGRTYGGSNGYSNRNINTNSNTNTYSAPVRSYTPSSGGSSGGASRGSSGGAVVRPPK